MSKNAINKLRLKFIGIFMGVLIAIIGLFSVSIHIINQYNRNRVINAALSYIVDQNGEINKNPKAGSFDDFSTEFHYSARYFSVTYNKDGSIARSTTSHIAAVSRSQAYNLARKALRSGDETGHYGVYYYKVAKLSKKQTFVVFLDCTTQIESSKNLTMTIIMVTLPGILLVFVCALAISKRAVRPEIENAERQNLFITNASHELKTPLAVIRANMEVEEMINGEDEWTKSTMNQVERMNGLIQNLVMIAKAQEQENREGDAIINVSTLINESIDPFMSLVQSENKQIIRTIQSDVMMKGDASKVRQLCSLLVDNAVKYCDDQGTITVALSALKKDKVIRLDVSNTYADGKNVDYTKFFDRFYRADQSHNIDRGGYGIGLSIAESIVRLYGGSIHASWKEGIITFTCMMKSKI